MILSFAGSIRDELKWKEINCVSVRAEKGYLILASCDEDTFLLIQLDNIPTSDFNQHMSHLLNKLQVEFQPTDAIQTEIQLEDRLTLIDNQPQTSTGYPVNVTEQSVLMNPSPRKLKLELEFIARCQDRLAEFIGPMASLVCEQARTVNPELGPSKFIQALAQYIPKREDAMNFQRRCQEDIYYRWYTLMNQDKI